MRIKTKYTFRIRLELNPPVCVTLFVIDLGELEWGFTATNRQEDNTDCANNSTYVCASVSCDANHSKILL